MAIVASSTFPVVVIALCAGAPAGELALAGPCADQRPGGLHGRPQAPGLASTGCAGPVRTGHRNRFSGSGYRVALPPKAARIGRNARGTPPPRRIAPYRKGVFRCGRIGRKRASNGDFGTGNRAGSGSEGRS